MAGSASDEVQSVYGELVRRFVGGDCQNGSYQVVTEELHDQSGVLVALLAQGVKLCDTS